MSYHALPQSVAWLQTADPETVQWEHIHQIAHDYAGWLVQCGVPAESIYDPDKFVQQGDLQTYSNVVSWWPADVPAQYHMPTLSILLQSMRIVGEPESFAQALERNVERIKAWMPSARINPDNPNESKAEREARLNRERVARHRLRHSKETDDPQLNELLAAAKAADANALAGKRWLKGEIQQAKFDMDAAIARAKADRSERVARAEAAVLEAEAQARSAKDAVESYRINK